MSAAHTPKPSISQADLADFREAVARCFSEYHPNRSHACSNDIFFRDINALGVFQLPFPSELGGLGGRTKQLAFLFQELGRNRVIHPLLDIFSALPFLKYSDHYPQCVTELLAGRSYVLNTALLKESRHPYPGNNVTITQKKKAWYANGISDYVETPGVSHKHLISCQLANPTSSSTETGVILLDSTHQTVDIQRQRSIDGSSIGRLALNNTPVQLLSLSPVNAAYYDSVATVLVLSMSECVGAMDELIRQTGEYLRARRQFNKSLSTFQALQFKLADLYIAKEIASAALDRAVALDTDGEDADTDYINAIACKAIVAPLAQTVATECIQLHGAIGYTEEALPGKYLRRILRLNAISPTAETCTAEYQSILVKSEMDQSLEALFSEQHTEFSRKVADIVNKELSNDIRNRVRSGKPLTKSDYTEWNTIAGRHGLLTGSWPIEFGGNEWDSLQQYILESTSGHHCAPDILPYGVKMVAPVLHKYGNQQQQAQHLPGIATSNIWWCQGYSEPNAGSDLASLQTKAQLVGEHYIVNGSKIWTTQAHYADWMHCLVRTGAPDSGKDGISFLLIDMTLPGITVRPITSIDGLHHLNEIFLDDVEVHRSQLVGEEGQGWNIARFLLANERSALAKIPQKKRMLKRVRKHIIGRGYRLTTTVESYCYWSTLATLKIKVDALEYLELKYLSNASNLPQLLNGAVLKIAATELQQEIASLGLRTIGTDSIVYDTDHLRSDSYSDDTSNSISVYEFLYNRAASIYGGTNEIQRTIIARYLLSR